MRYGAILFPVILGLAGCGPTSAPLMSAGGPRTTRVETGSGATIEIETVADAPGVVSGSVNVPPERAWQALPAAYEAVGLPGDFSDPTARLFGVRGRRVARSVAGTPITTIVDCGTGLAGPNVLFYQVTLDVVTRIVEADGGGTRLETSLSGSAKPREVSGNPVACVSKGELERVIAQKVAELAGS